MISWNSVVPTTSYHFNLLFAGHRSAAWSAASPSFFDGISNLTHRPLALFSRLSLEAIALGTSMGRWVYEVGSQMEQHVRGVTKLLRRCRRVDNCWEVGEELSFAE